MSKYDALETWLKGCGRQRAELTFAGVEEILGEGLPMTARCRRQWWANSGANERDRHVQAKAWYRAGYAVETVDFDEETVCFVRL